MTTKRRKIQLVKKLEGFVTSIAKQYPGIDAKEALSLATEQAAKIKFPKRKNRIRNTVEPENRCLARVWRTGSGDEQCSLQRGENMGFDCYCKVHAKKAAVTEEPLQTDVDGKSHVGLFMGRIDQPLPWKDSSGLIRIEWKSDEHKALVAKEIQEKTAHRHADAKRGRPKKVKSVLQPSKKFRRKPPQDIVNQVPKEAPESQGGVTTLVDAEGLSCKAKDCTAKRETGNYGYCSDHRDGKPRVKKPTTSAASTQTDSQEEISVLKTNLKKSNQELDKKDEEIAWLKEKLAQAQKVLRDGVEIQKGITQLWSSYI
jgi:hypothetical protein